MWGKSLPQESSWAVKLTELYWRLSTLWTERYCWYRFPNV